MPSNCVAIEQGARFASNMHDDDARTWCYRALLYCCYRILLVATELLLLPTYRLLLIATHFFLLLPTSYCYWLLIATAFCLLLPTSPYCYRLLIIFTDFSLLLATYRLLHYPTTGLGLRNMLTLPNFSGAKLLA